MKHQLGQEISPAVAVVHRARDGCRRIIEYYLPSVKPGRADEGGQVAVIPMNGGEVEASDLEGSL